MKSEMWIFCFLTIYGALVLGVVLKFITYGLRGDFLLTSLVAPLCLLIGLPVFLIKKRYQETEAISLLYILRTFGVSFMLFPVSVGFLAECMVKSRQKTRNRKDDYIASFDAVYVYFNSQKLA